MRRATKYHMVMATLLGETDAAVQMNITHADYGTMPSTWVPKSVIMQDSLNQMENATEGDDMGVGIAGWWFRKNWGYPE